jgi:hypothetical protein
MQQFMDQELSHIREEQKLRAFEGRVPTRIFLGARGRK